MKAALSTAAAVLAVSLVAGAPAARGDALDDAVAAARAAAGRGDYLDAFEQFKEAELVLWGRMTRMELRRAVLVTEEPPYFGAYTPRESNAFSPGEKILLYVEPVGYTLREEGDVYRLSLTADFTLADTAGSVLGGQKDFGSWEMISRRPVTEFMMFFTYDFSGLSPGTYTVETTLHDRFSEKTLKIETPITMKK